MLLFYILVHLHKNIGNHSRTQFYVHNNLYALYNYSPLDREMQTLHTLHTLNADEWKHNEKAMEIHSTKLIIRSVYTRAQQFYSHFGEWGNEWEWAVGAAVSSCERMFVCVCVMCVGITNRCCL